MCTDLQFLPLLSSSFEGPCPAFACNCCPRVAAQREHESAGQRRSQPAAIRQRRRESGFSSTRAFGLVPNPILYVCGASITRAAGTRDQIATPGGVAGCSVRWITRASPPGKSIHGAPAPTVARAPESVRTTHRDSSPSSRKPDAAPMTTGGRTPYSTRRSDRRRPESPRVSASFVEKKAPTTSTWQPQLSVDGAERFASCSTGSALVRA
jgi:hypothetical protein